MTKEERLILINQYMIMKKIKVDDYDVKDLDNKIDILSNGWTFFYEDEIFSSGLYEETDESIEKEVYEILNMYRIIGITIDEQNMSDLPGYPSFFGFDGNEETEHYALMEFIINKMQRFDESTASNSHSRTLSIYRGMLRKFSEIKNKKISSDWKFSKEEVLEVLNSSL